MSIFEDKEVLEKAERICDEETRIVCYCGKLATGLHTAGCNKYYKHLKTKYEDLLKEKQDEKQ